MNKPAFWLISVIAALAAVSPALAADAPPAPGETFPPIALVAPEDPARSQYLGLPPEMLFRIPDIKADLVILEIFSMYCPYCQKEAPNVNKLYSAIQSRADIRDKIKIIGIGVGNSSFEVDVFRQNYNILFPLFPDEDFIIHYLVGQVRTPYFFAIKIKKDGSARVIYSQLGGIEDINGFLDAILTEAGLK